MYLLTAFLGIYTRYLLLGLSRIAGSVCKFLATGWRPIALWLIISAEIVVIWQILKSTVSGSEFSIQEILTPEAAGAAIVIFAFGFILNAGLKARNNVVIENFIDHTQAETSQSPSITGLSNLLVIELRRLHNLYGEVDERRPISSLGGRKSLLDYAIRVDDTGEILKNALASGTNLSLGPFTVPIGAIVGVLGKIVQGPRISGGYHQDGDLHILTAQMFGKTARSWRVEGRIASEGDILAQRCNPNLSIPYCQDGKVMLLSDKGGIKNIDAMVRELACRMFTDLTSGGSSRWKATHAFNDGMREYRKTIYSSKDWRINLKNAERMFLQAISEDNTFDLAWYNLGVVYTELNKWSGNRIPAHKAFLNAVKHNPGRWQAYFAMALNRFGEGTDKRRTDPQLGYDLKLIDDVIHHCTQADALSRSNAKIHDLMGVCYRIRAIQVPFEQRQEFFIRAEERNAFASKMAWREICADEFAISREIQGEVDDNRKTCWITLWDQAKTLYFPLLCEAELSDKDRLSPIWRLIALHTTEKILDQARIIDRSNAILECELGNLYYFWGRYDHARHAYEAACRIEPTNLKYWTQLALSCARTSRCQPDQMEMALSKIMENPTDVWAKLSPRWRKEIRTAFPKDGIGLRLREIFDFCLRIEDFERSKPDDPRFSLENMLIQYESEKSAGTRRDMVATALNIARLYAGAGNYENALQFYGHALHACLDNERWEKGLIFADLGSTALQVNNIKRASECYYRAVDLLADYNGEIKKRGIERTIVEALIPAEGFTEEAFKIANQAYAQNPSGFNELAAMGKCLVASNDYREAQLVFESAILLRPNDVNTLTSIGYCYWEQSRYCQKTEEKKTYSDEAINYLEKVRGMLDETDIDNKSLLSFLIGACYFDCADYGQALYNLEIADALSVINEKKIVIQMKIALAYLHKRDHTRAEYWFSQIIDSIENNLAPEEKSSLNDLETAGIEANISPTLPKSQGQAGISLSGRGDATDKLEKTEKDTHKPILNIEFTVFNQEQVLGYIYINALLGKAYSLAERDAAVDKTNNEASALVRRAEKAYSLISEKHPDITIKARIADRTGWIHYKNERLDEAEKAILQALSLNADPEYHLHLAYVLASRVAEIGSGDAQKHQERKAIAQCNHVIDMAANPDLAGRAERLKDTIQKKSQGQGT